MKIIKSSDNAIYELMGEMINIEASMKIYDGLTKLKNPEKGYPKTIIGNAEYIHKTNVGIIFVPKVNSLTLKLVKELNELIEDFEINSFKDIPMEYGHLHEYHTIVQFQHTNIKIQCENNLSIVNNSIIGTTDGSNNLILPNIKRNIMIKENIGTGKYKNIILYPRFTWIITGICNMKLYNNKIYYINRIRPSIYNNSKNIFENNITSIFYDIYDICNKPNGSQIFNFTNKDITNLNIIHDIDFNIYFNGIFELKNVGNCVTLMGKMNKMNKKIYLAGYKELTFIITLDPTDENYLADYKELTFINTSDFKSLVYKPRILDGLDRCYSCQTEIYDYNYFTCVNKKTKIGFIMCPLCIHYGFFPFTLAYIFKFKSPKSINDVIKSSNLSDIKKDILYELNKSVVFKTLKSKYINGNIHYREIGDKYLGFYSKEDYLFSDFSKIKINRTIITLKELIIR